MIVQLFSAMDKSHGMVKGVSLSEFMDYLKSKHFLEALIHKQKHFNIFENSHHVKSEFTQKEIDEVRHKLLAASFTVHGSDLGALYDRIDTDGNGTLGLEKVRSSCLFFTL